MFTRSRGFELLLVIPPGLIFERLRVAKGLALKFNPLELGYKFRTPGVYAMGSPMAGCTRSDKRRVFPPAIAMLILLLCARSCSRAVCFGDPQIEHEWRCAQNFF